MILPKRKPTRLKGYDYSQNGAYFITICTHNRKCLFSNIVGAIHELPDKTYQMVIICIGICGMSRTPFPTIIVGLGDFSTNRRINL